MREKGIVFYVIPVDRLRAELMPDDSAKESFRQHIIPFAVFRKNDNSIVLAKLGQHILPDSLPYHASCLKSKNVCSGGTAKDAEKREEGLTQRFQQDALFPQPVRRIEDELKNPHWNNGPGLREIS